MTWGGDGYLSVPDGTTWTDITGRGWESEGTLSLWSGGISFNVYSAVWTSPAWGAWTDITSSIGLLNFQTNRAIASWWRGTRAGSATLTIEFEVDDYATLDQRFYIGNRITITADVPSGEQYVFAGLVSNRSKIYSGSSYPQMVIQLTDHMGWGAQSVHPATPFGAGPFTTGATLYSLVANYVPAISVTELGGINAANGLSQNGTFGAGNAIDRCNSLLRAELGIMFTDRAGNFQFKQRDWWHPYPDPVATIGSTDRGSGGDRDDPGEGDTGYKFPVTSTRWTSPIGYTYFTWTHPYATPPTSTTTGAAVTNVEGWRKWNDTVNLVTIGDVSNNLAFLINNLSPQPDDSSVTVTFPADLSTDSQNYAAVAEIGDFIEVAKETQRYLDRREWYPAYVVGVRHSWNASIGWTVTLDATLELPDSETDPE